MANSLSTPLKLHYLAKYSPQPHALARLFSNFLMEMEVVKEALLKFPSTLLHYQILYINAQPYPLYYVPHPGSALHIAL